MSLINSGAREVLTFWFGEGDSDADVIAEKSAMWFARDEAVDAAIDKQFAALRQQAVAGNLDAWTSTPHDLLALIVLVDQFSRNLFRNDARAFEHDALARSWTDGVLASGRDRELRTIERVFVYLPLEHSESITDQQRSIECFSALTEEVSTELRKPFANFRDFAQRHYDIVARFGRFPHRNAVLGRTSTDEELAFLQEPGAHF